VGWAMPYGNVIATPYPAGKWAKAEQEPWAQVRICNRIVLVAQL